MNYTDLIGEAAEWRLISLLLECPSGPEWRRQVTALGRESADPALRAAAEAARDEASEGVYHSIFGPGGPAPSREVSYHDNIQLGYLMSEVVNYYEAFQYQPKVEEPEDHVAVETGFIGYLRLKQAYALAGDDVEAEAVTREAAKQFLDDHLSRVAQPLAASLAQSGVSYLAQVTGALLKRVGPPRTLPVMAQHEPDDCEMACGG